MNIWQVIRRSWTYYWQIHLAMVLAVALTTAVLTGALTVGDSMRGSLRQLTLDRLGPIDQVVLSQTFFDAAMVERWKKDNRDFSSQFADATATIHFPAATIERTDSSGISNSALQSWASVQVWGVDETLASWDWADKKFPAPEEKEIIVNQSAAHRMGLSSQDIGQLLTLRLGKPSDVPAESFIATKDDSVTSIPRLKLKAIVADEGLGRLSLTPGTDVPGLVFLNPVTLRRSIPDATVASRENQNAETDADEIQLCNALLVRGKTDVGFTTPEEAKKNFASLRPSLADAGLKLTNVTLSGGKPDVKQVLNYYSISSSRMLIDNGQQQAIISALSGLENQPVLTYLANRIASVDDDQNGIPFSMVSALDWTQDFYLNGSDGQRLPEIKDDEIVLNQWAAEDLKVKVGDRIRLKYYEPETVDGNEIERQADFTLVGVAALTKPAEPYKNRGRRVIPAEFDAPPTRANDPSLTPEVPGVTDAASIDRWELPFETGSAIRSQDDQYWQEYRTTPKAFVSKATGQKLWGNRFGAFTSYRVPANVISLEDLQLRLEKAVGQNLSQVGFQIIPAKAAGLAGSQGSTPFDVLFLMFSMFVIVSSLMLLGLFFRLGMQQRSKELGLWLALGFSEKSARGVWLKESLGSTVFGILVGSLLGIAYAWLITYLMRTAWVGAVASPFLYLHWSWMSLIVGAICSLLVSLLVIWWSVRQATRVSTRSLLTGGWSDANSGEFKARWWHGCTTRRTLLVIALLLSVAGYFAVGDTQAVVFLAGGFCALMAVLMYEFDQLVHRTFGNDFRWSSVAQLNLSRQPLRSMIIISLVGLATFLIVAVSAFRLSPSERGTAGFDYVARTDVGVQENLNAKFATKTGAKQWSYGFRFHDGEHASCNNPFQARQPQVLGIADDFVDRFADPQVKPFAWAGTTAATSEQSANPWQLLTGGAKRKSGDAVPVVIDKNTAWYSLKVYLPGSRFTIPFSDAGDVEFELVGLLDNSVLQGALLVGDEDYVRLFPEDSGKRFFLIDSQSMEDESSKADSSESDKSTSALATLGQDLKEFGWQVDPADQILANYMAVQNTYLSAFQSLGSLGLLLGTIGLIVAQYRSLLERKREIALFQAIGFKRNSIHQLISAETIRLILYGFVAGIGGALVCVLPHWLSGAASVPWLGLLLTLSCILLIGLVASSVIGVLVMRGRLVGLLRAE